MAVAVDPAFEPVFRGFCKGELDDAFNRVAPAGDWRDPIDAKCWEVDRDAVEAAVLFFTATQPAFEALPAAQGHAGLGRRLRVTAAGYRMGPAGG